MVDKSGTVEFNTDTFRHRRPVWLVALKLLGVVAMVAVGAAIAIPTFLEFEFPLWHAIAATALAMVLYIGVAFFVRPDPNTDDLTNVNKFLWNLHCVLGPGRFISDTFLDVGVLLGLVKTDEPEEVDQRAFGSVSVNSALAQSGPCGVFDASRPIAPLDPNRFALSSANSVTEKIHRDSQRFVPQAPAR